jgi:hypothetical protein
MAGISFESQTAYRSVIVNRTPPQLPRQNCPARGHFFGAQSPKKRSYFPAQKSGPHFLIEPSGIRGPRRAVRIGGLMDQMYGMFARDPRKKLRELLFKLECLE